MPVIRTPALAVIIGETVRTAFSASWATATARFTRVFGIEGDAGDEGEGHEILDPTGLDQCQHRCGAGSVAFDEEAAEIVAAMKQEAIGH